jgi:hypothetical protein
MEPDGPVIMGTRLQAGQPENWDLIVDRGGKSSLCHLSRLALEPTRSLVYCVLGTLSVGVKLLGCDADHPPRSGGYEILELYLHKTAPVVSWSEFLATDPEVLSSIPGLTRFSEK